MCVARSGPGAGRKRVGPKIGAEMKAAPAGCRRVSGLAATVQSVGGVIVAGRKLVVRVLVSCFWRASLV